MKSLRPVRIASFTTSPAERTDGLPAAPCLFKSGKLYGTAQAGGAGCTWGCGVVFEYTLAKGKNAGKETVLYTFAGVPDGQSPMYGALVFDKQGNVYGTTRAAAAFPGGTNLGTVYKLAPNGTETILYNFDQQPKATRPWEVLLSTPRATSTPRRPLAAMARVSTAAAP